MDVDRAQVLLEEARERAVASGIKDQIEYSCAGRAAAMQFLAENPGMEEEFQQFELQLTARLVRKQLEEIEGQIRAPNG